MQKYEAGQRIQTRVQRTLEMWDKLPDEAVVDGHIVGALTGRSRSSRQRDVAAGRLPPPVRVGACGKGWTVGSIRTALQEARSK